MRSVRIRGLDRDVATLGVDLARGPDTLVLAWARRRDHGGTTANGYGTMPADGPRFRGRQAAAAFVSTKRTGPAASPPRTT